MSFINRAEQIIKADEWMMECLRCVAELNLPDWYIGAGFVRNKIWDELHGISPRTPLNDVDVVYFDPEVESQAQEQAYERRLHEQMPKVPWSVKNQAFIHKAFHQQPFNSSAHAIANWVELPTCVGVRLSADGKQLAFTSVDSMASIFELRVTPNNGNNVPLSVYRQRVKKKNWQRLWPKLKVDSL